VEADKVMAVVFREMAVLAEVYARRPSLFEPKKFKDQVEDLASWGRRALTVPTDSNFLKFTQFQLDSRR
jgi:hypothetical protein